MKIGLDTFLTMVLAILKLTGIISISWWWVFAPMIVSTVALLGALIIVGAVSVFAIKKNVLVIKK